MLATMGPVPDLVYLFLPLKGVFNSQAKTVMRKEAVYTLLLNVTLFPGMKFSVTPDTKYMRFSAIEDGQTVHYNLKVSFPSFIVTLC